MPTILGEATQLVGQVDNIVNLETVEKLNDLTNHSYSAPLTGTQELQANLVGAGSFRVFIVGSWTGRINFECTINGTDWIRYDILPFSQALSTISAAETFTTSVNGQWTGNAAALRAFRVKGATITGTANVSIEVNHAVSISKATIFADGFIDINNTTIVPLAANATFTGQPTVILPFMSIDVALFSDQDSAPTGSEFQFSIDGINWDFKTDFLVLANKPMLVPFDRRALFFRIVYKNGPIAQTAFRMLTVLQRLSPAVPKSLMSNSIFEGRSAVLSRSVIAGRVAGDVNFADVKVNPNGSLFVEPVALPPDAARETKQDAEIAAINTLLKPANTLTKVATVDTITNNVNVVLVNPAPTQWKHAEPGTTQTGLAVWTPASGKKIAVTSITLLALADIVVTLWFSETSTSDTAFTLGTDQVVFRGQVANGQNYLMDFNTPRKADLADMPLRLTTSANGQIYVTVYGYETT